MDFKTNKQYYDKLQRRIMEKDDFSQKVYDFLNESSKGLSPELIEFLREKFESNIVNWFGEEPGDLQVKLVVDSNTVIRSLKHFAKTGKIPLLFKLKSNPMFPIYSPIELEKEVIEYIECKEKNQKYKLKMKEGWSLVKQNIIFKKEVYIESWNKASKVIGGRDKDDIPFVGVYFDLKATAVVTDDRDYEHPEIRRFNIESLGEVVGTYHKGVFSFFILNDLSPLVFELIKQLSVSILKILSEFLLIFVGLSKALISGAISKISQLAAKAPSWFWWFLLGAFGVAAIVLLIRDGARKKVSDTIHSGVEKIKPIITKILELLQKLFSKLIEYVEKAAPYAGMTAIAIKELSDNVQRLRDEIKSLTSEEALSSS